MSPRRVRVAPHQMPSHGPADLPSRSPAAGIEAVPGRASERPVTVLLADDYPRYRTGIARAIALRPPLQVIAEVDNGAAALEEILRLRPDIALLDMRMPRLTGLEVVRRIRARPDPPPTRLIVMTAQIDDGIGHGITEAERDLLLLDKATTRDALCTALLDAVRRP